MVKKHKNKTLSSPSVFSRRNFILFLAIFALIGSYLILRSFAQTAIDVNAKLYVSPASKSVRVGDNISVQVRLQNAYLAPLHFVRANMNFSYNRLAISGISYSGGYFGTLDHQTYDNSFGTLSITVSDHQSKQPQADVLVATINFNAKTVGSGNLSFDSTKSFVSSSSGGPNFLKSTSGGTYTINAVVPPAPTVHIGASPSSTPYNGSTTLSWSSVNASSCNASGAWGGSKPTSGTAKVSNMKQTSKFSLTCSGGGGSSSSSVTVSVGKAPSPPPPGTPPPPPTPSGHPSSPPPSPSSSPSSPKSSGGSSNTGTTSSNSGSAFITEVKVSDITDNSVTLSWKTTTSSSAQINYGTSPSNLYQSVSDDANQATHKLTLTELDPGQKYYFTIAAIRGDQEYDYQGDFSTTGTPLTPNQPTKHGGSGVVAIIIITLVLLAGFLLWLLAAKRRRNKDDEYSRYSSIETPLPPLPEAKEPYTPHSLLSKEKAKSHSHRGSIAAGSVEEPKDMFEEGRERLEHEGISKDEH